MNRYEKLKEMSLEDVGWFVLTIIETTENQMLHKLSEYGLEVSVVSLDSNIRHAAICCDLLKEDNDASNT